MKTWRSILETGTTVVICLMAIVVIWKNMRPSAEPSRRPAATTIPIPKDPVVLGTSTKGKEDAPLAMVVFSDFECPFCGAFSRDTLPSIQKKYVDTGLLIIGFRHFPNQNIHPHAQFSAEAAACAGKQGKFWAMHDRFFESGAVLDKKSIEAGAKAIGLNLTLFRQCLKEDGPSIVDEDLSAATALQINASPAFLIGGLRPDRKVEVVTSVLGAQGLGAFQKAIEDASAKKRTIRPQ